MKDNKIIFDFLKRNLDSNKKELIEKFNIFCNKRNLVLDNSIILEIVENKDIFSNLKLLHSIEVYVEDTLENIIKKKGILQIVGTVSYIELETGFWGIKSDNENWNPINFPDDLKKEGLEVKIKIKLLPNTMTTTMWGKNVKILNYEKIIK